MTDELPHSWLKERLTAATVDAILEHEVARLADGFTVAKEKLAALVEARPKEKWHRFLSVSRAGDELWNYSSPEQTWENFCGVAGYALVRDGVVVASVATLRN